MTSKYNPIVCALKNYNLDSRVKFEPGPEFEPPIIVLSVLRYFPFPLDLINDSTFLRIKEYTFLACREEGTFITLLWDIWL